MMKGGEEAAKKKAGQDGEFVLLGQGRHVLDNTLYSNIKIEKLSTDKVRVGPVTVLYIKEGSIGGAYERNTGKFLILHPGPPYILHEKEFEGIQLVKRSLERFQLLPPGHTYQLHEKDYEDIQVAPRSNLFTLGPNTFLTVQNGCIAGAWRKRGGEFVLLPPPKSYRLNEDEYGEPSLAKRDKHVVRCGPLTFLTVQEGFLMGAYRTKDGRFEEFDVDDDRKDEFVLHDRDFHGLTVVNKYSTEVQKFGPNLVVTIPEGECGVFEREGALEIKDPGFYKMSAEYRIRENIPLRVNTESFDGMEFRTK